MHIVSRNGGTEFSVILRDCKPGVALRIAEKIRKSVEDFSFKVANPDLPLNITVSIGVSTYPDANKSLNQLSNQLINC